MEEKKLNVEIQKKDMSSHVQRAPDNDVRDINTPN